MASPGLNDYLHDAAYQSTRARAEIETTRSALQSALDRMNDATPLAAATQDEMDQLLCLRDDWQGLIERLHRLAKRAGPRESLVAGWRER